MNARVADHYRRAGYLVSERPSMEGISGAIRTPDVYAESEEPVVVTVIEQRAARARDIIEARVVARDLCGRPVVVASSFSVDALRWCARFGVEALDAAAIEEASRDALDEEPAVEEVAPVALIPASFAPSTVPEAEPILLDAGEGGSAAALDESPLDMQAFDGMAAAVEPAPAEAAHPVARVEPEFVAAQHSSAASFASLPDFLTAPMLPPRAPEFVSLPDFLTADDGLRCAVAAPGLVPETDFASLPLFLTTVGEPSPAIDAPAFVPHPEFAPLPDFLTADDGTSESDAPRDAPEDASFEAMLDAAFGPLSESTVDADLFVTVPVRDRAEVVLDQAVPDPMEATPDFEAAAEAKSAVAPLLVQAARAGWILDALTQAPATDPSVVEEESHLFPPIAALAREADIDVVTAVSPSEAPTPPSPPAEPEPLAAPAPALPWPLPETPLPRTAPGAVDVPGLPWSRSSGPPSRLPWGSRVVAAETPAATDDYDVTVRAPAQWAQKERLDAMRASIRREGADLLGLNQAGADGGVWLADLKRRAPPTLRI